MHITPEKIKDNGFIPITKVKHADFNSFILNSRWQNFRWHFIFNLLLFLFFLLFAFFFFSAPNPIISRLLWAGLGIFVAFLIVPFHEFIHYSTYKCLGAKKATITPYIRKGYILTHADHFVVRKKEVKWIAIMPFILISVSLLLSLTIFNAEWQILVSTTLLMHTSICHADFRILDYFMNNKNEILMYDDIKKGLTYIYKKSHSNEFLND